jgi:Tfp pilus assembly protein PilF
VVYLSALHHEFVEWDDSQYVVENVHIRSLDTAFFKWAFSAFHAGNWHPLTWISHAIDYAVWGSNALGHHLTSIVLHACNTVLVVLFIQTLLAAASRADMNAGSSNFLSEPTILVAAGATGLLFGLHPLHVESVAWVAERKDLLCALFFLSSLVTYTNYVIGQRPSAGGWRVDIAAAADTGGKTLFKNTQYLLTLGFFVLALLSKPMAVSLPFVLLLLDWHPFSRIRSRTTLIAVGIEKLPFIALSLLSSVVTLLAQTAGGAVVSLESVPLSTRMLVGIRSLLVYLGKMIVPLNLSPFYPYPANVAAMSGEYLVAIVLMIGITLLCVVMVNKQNLWLSVWSYYVVTLAPVIGIVQVGRQAMADRYTYLPSLGPFLILGLAAAWASRVTNPAPPRRPIGKAVLLVLAVVVAGAMTAATVHQVGIWKDSIRLWTHVIEQRPERIQLAYYYRGLAFLNMGRPGEAIGDFDRAIAMDPNFRDAFLNRGTAFENMGRYDRAIEDFNAAIAVSPSYETYYNRGIAFEKTGRLDKAIADYHDAIAMDPSRDEAYLAMGRVQGKTGSFDKAIEYFTRAIIIDPANAESYNNRGLSYLYRGHDDRAREDFTKAIALDPSIAIAYHNRGTLYLRAGNKGLALLDFRRACDLGIAKACTALTAIQ